MGKPEVGIVMGLVLAIDQAAAYGQAVQESCIGTADEWIGLDADWHEKHLGGSGKGSEFEAGFIAGMRQSQKIAEMQRGAATFKSRQSRDEFESSLGATS